MNLKLGEPLNTNAPEPTYEELKQKLEALEKQANKTKDVSFKVGDKGGVSVYGLGRFPVTLYYEQWIRLIDSIPALQGFMESNKANLKMKE